ncbi:SnoaL-like domain protein [Rhodobacteraceae bacterium THAF1]|uniref:SgcJ/EcaC family oxidoreductase n=1 Tax=Palleronia sp. THAF1 TaxID=2587842 RepID=UPI000F3AC96B|nr:SgcJ/EcaC family oxidoreductase [Palleronia sp. THAF1]QFU09270.1 SnoaL-like domain protein [Palleronia sp. THAF1]VDC26571.1 SnoaL-like domain protein [Rhodobacteraceae bacterium THAF1]
MLNRAQDMPTAFRDSWMARDAEALAALFAPDADFVNVTGLWWRSRDAIRKAHHYGLTTFFANTTLRVGRVETRDLEETALVHARLTLTGQVDTDGSALDTRRTMMLFVMARTPEGWHCVAAQNTDIQPGAETMTAKGGALTPRDYR